LIEEFQWSIAANVAPRTLTQTPYAQTAAPPLKQSAKITLEVTDSTTGEWKTNALACPTAA
jgi:hypothetical protein